MIAPTRGGAVEVQELGKDSRGRRVACPAGKNVDNVFKDEMSKRISPAFAVTEGKVHIALPENCPYDRVARLNVEFGVINARFFSPLRFVLNDGRGETRWAFRYACVNQRMKFRKHQSWKIFGRRCFFVEKGCGCVWRKGVRT